jgi:hypothetical protein
MTAAAYDLAPAQAEPRIDPALEIAEEILASELALEDLLVRAERLHNARIEHEPLGCLVCFSQR